MVCMCRVSVVLYMEGGQTHQYSMSSHSDSGDRSAMERALNEVFTSAELHRIWNLQGGILNAHSHAESVQDPAHGISRQQTTTLDTLNNTVQQLQAYIMKNDTVFTTQLNMLTDRERTLQRREENMQSNISKFQELQRHATQRLEEYYEERKNTLELYEERLQQKEHVLNLKAVHLDNLTVLMTDMKTHQEKVCTQVREQIQQIYTVAQTGILCPASSVDSGPVADVIRTPHTIERECHKTLTQKHLLRTTGWMSSQDRSPKRVKHTDTNTVSGEKALC